MPLTSFDSYGFMSEVIRLHAKLGSCLELQCSVVLSLVASYEPMGLCPTSAGAWTHEPGLTFGPPSMWARLTVVALLGLRNGSIYPRGHLVPFIFKLLLTQNLIDWPEP